MMKSKRAFTLVELLVVISIILLASSVIFLGTGGGEGAKLSSAQRIVSGIAQGARGQAILKNTETRLIIHNDPSDPEKYLRYFGIVYYGDELDAAGNVVNTGWLAATQGTYLPEGIYFSEPLSQSNDFGDFRGPIPDTISLDFPRARVGANTNQLSGGGGTEFFQYGYNANGTSANPNEWLVLQAGTLRPVGPNAYEIDFDAVETESLKAALIFRRAGSVTRVDDPLQID
jgi:prepilin-type N-terminal cleavage/methylation domain-containing protein